MGLNHDFPKSKIALPDRNPSSAMLAYSGNIKFSQNSPERTIFYWTCPLVMQISESLAWIILNFLSPQCIYFAKYGHWLICLKRVLNKKIKSLSNFTIQKSSSKKTCFQHPSFSFWKQGLQWDSVILKFMICSVIFSHFPLPVPLGAPGSEWLFSPTSSFPLSALFCLLIPNAPISPPLELELDFIVNAPVLEKAEPSSSNSESDYKKLK